MWKKDRNIVILTVGLLALVLLFCIGCHRFFKGPLKKAEEYLREKFSAAESGAADGQSAPDSVVISVRAGTARTVRKRTADSGDRAEPQEPAYGKGKIALTFDDGPHPTYTPQLLDGLAERKVKASFFITGKNAEEYPELVKRLDDEGHLIGNHTYSHLQLNKNNGEAFRAELVKTNEIISNITGKEVVYVRPPYGSWDKRFETELNMFPVLWNIDPLDWSSKDANGIVKRVVSKVKENSVILMHDEYSSTVTAALQIVDQLQKEGYEFVTVEEILFD